ncbi:MAG TPA: hypothetical protein VKA07_00335 [Candidatus Sulfotelmatobacter sp.]|nr:hypothetical protein [Candidatus Sulfotelmatobacter sp.]HLM82283.1 hypothetical protein [Terriglobales bacterium]
MNSRTEANINQLASDVHFVTAPLRFAWHALLWLVFLLFAPAIFAIVPVLALKYASPDEIWLLKWLFGVLGPFASTFWFVIIAMIPAHDRGDRGLVFQLKSFGAMAFGFVVSAGAMFFFATNYGVRYEWDDRGWFTGAGLCLLSPFALLAVCRLIRRVRRGGE